jgi:hypothetical protein
MNKYLTLFYNYTSLDHKNLKRIKMTNWPYALRLGVGIIWGEVWGERYCVIISFRLSFGP